MPVNAYCIKVILVVVPDKTAISRLPNWAEKEKTMENPARLDPEIDILIGESSPLQQSYFEKVFSEFQLKNIKIVKDGYTLVETAAAGNYALIIIDNGLSKANSLTTVAQLRAEPKYAEIPIIFTYEKSGETTEDENMLIRDAKAAGASVVMCKPISAVDLCNEIELLFGKFILSTIEQNARAEQSLKATETAVSLGKNLQDSGNLDGAEKAFTKAITDVLFGIAEVYLSKGEKEAADEVIREAQVLDPAAKENFRKRLPDFIERGYEKIKKKRLHHAKMEFEAALAFDDTNIPALAGLSETLYNLNRPEDALEKFKTAVAQKGSTEERMIFKKMGLTAFKWKEYDLALLAFDKALQFIQGDPQLFYQHALVHVAKWNFPEALTSITKALKLHPDFPEALRVRGKINQWSKAMEEKKKEEAASSP